MIVNRIRQLPPELPDGAPRAGSYWILRTENVRLLADERTAQRIMRLLRRWWRPRWISITDRHGARVRLRPADIVLLYESTPITRASDRRMDMALETEENMQRPPWLDGL